MSEAKRAAGTRCRNEVLLDDFAEYLRKSGFSSREAMNHRKNVSAFLNRYLLDELDVRMEDGPEHVGKYFRKVYPWRAKGADPEGTKEAAKSLLLFYRCMEEEEYVCTKEVDRLERRIKISMPVWIRSYPKKSSAGTDHDKRSFGKKQNTNRKK